MSKSNEYRSFAAYCLNFANSTSDLADKTRLLTMAEAWRDLAERADRVVQQDTPTMADDPLVQKILRRDGGTEVE